MPEIKALNGTVRVDRNEEGEVFLHVQEDNENKDEAVLFGSQVRMTLNQAVQTYLAIEDQVDTAVKVKLKKDKLRGSDNRTKSV